VKSYVRERQQVRYFAAESEQYKEMSMDLAKIDACSFR
jgi:ATP-binding cassette subfamily B multidrug efflux pump